MAISFAQVADALDEKSLHLILLPTEACNFRCTYCYEDFTVGKMQRRVVDAVMALLDRRGPNLERLEIGWFGGEPLLAKDIIYEVSSHATSLVARYPSLRYAANVTTNGYFLDRNTAEKLAGLGVNSYQISLDGPREIHNATRVRADSVGTFDRIWTNLLGIRDSDIDVGVTIRVHFTPDSVLALDRLIEEINDEFQDDDRFCVYFKDVGRLGGQNDNDIRLFSERLINEARAHLTSKLANPRQAASLDAAEHYICYASKPTSLLIRPNGHIGKCTVALYDDRNSLGTINDDGTMALDQDKLRSWMLGFVGPDERALSCPLSAMNRGRMAPSPREDAFTFVPLSLTKGLIHPEVAAAR